MTGNIITIKNLSKRFSDKAVLDNVNLDIRKGEVFGILGSNGSGKTTLLNTLIGFYKAHNGIILFDEKPYHQIKNIKKKFGMATQDCSFYPNLTVLENIVHFARLHDIEKSGQENNALATLKLLNLHEKKNALASALSGGMQRRVDIACAMAHSPQVLLLDEPTANLDIFLRREMINLIKLINNVGVTVIIASHILSELEEVCDRIAVIDHGKILKVGTVGELLNQESINNEIIIETASKDYAKIIQELHKVTKHQFSYHIENSKLVIKTRNMEHFYNVIIAVLAKLKEHIVHLDIRRGSLEEIFTKLINV